MNRADRIKLTILLIAFIVFVEIPVLLVFWPLIEVLTAYPLLISVISTVLAILAFAYGMTKTEKELGQITWLIIAILIFWVLLQISTIATVELRYHDVVSKYSSYSMNFAEKGLNSSWAVAVKFRKEFIGTYGRNETLPNRGLTSYSGFFLGFTPLFLAYLEWFDGYEKIIVLQKKGNCGEFAIAIKTLLHDVTGIKTRKINMEGFDHAFPEVYWNGSWWIFDGIFTTPTHPVKAELYADYLKKNYRNVYENVRNLREDTKTSLLAGHGFTAANITIVAIVDPTSSKSDDKPAKNADVEIFSSKNWYDPLVDKGKADDEGRYKTVLRGYGNYVIVVKSSDERFLGVLNVEGSGLKDGDEIVVRLHKYE